LTELKPVEVETLKFVSDLNMVRWFYRELKGHTLRCSNSKSHRLLYHNGIVTRKQGVPWRLTDYGLSLLHLVEAERSV
jgi:hypothetical protein